MTPTATGRMGDDRRAIKEWIESIERRFNVSKVDISKRAGVPHSTLYRWISEDGTVMPSYAKLRKLADAFGVDMPGAEPRGSGDSDLDPLDEASEDPNHLKFVVRSRALELAGVVPGDIIVIDKTEAEKSGDVVVAYVFNLEKRMTEMKVRSFEPPFLVTKSMDKNISDKPLLIDNEAVTVIGPMVELIRRRR